MDPAVPDGVAALDEVVGLLDLDHGPGDTRTGHHTRLAAASGHVYGGLVAAQAVVAATASVEAGRALHSLHAAFLRRGDPAVPITFAVERTRDGRGFTHRRVEALQHGRPIMQLSCSFAIGEPGLQHQTAPPLVPDPETLPSDVDLLAAAPDPDAAVTRSGPFETRTAGTHARLARDRGERSAASRTWLRAHAPLGDDPRLHRALLVYASDMTVLDPTTRPSGLSLADDVLPATLDHAVWLHEDVRVDEWFLVDADSPWAGHGRGLGRARVFTGSGVLVADIAQEGLIRPVRPTS